MSKLSKVSAPATDGDPFAGIDPDERRAKIWDHENGCWVNLTDEEIEKRWPSKKEK